MNLFYSLAATLFIGCVLYWLMYIRNEEEQEPVLPINKLERDVKHVFWTGGYDSTFRILQIVIDWKESVQPVYIYGCDTRENKDLELQIMNEITTEMNMVYPGKIRPIYVIDARHVKLDSNIISAMTTMMSFGWFTRPISQYTYMAQATRDLDMVIETGSEKGEHTILSKVVAGKLDYFRLREDVYIKEPYLRIFDKISFPLHNTSKAEMWDTAEKGNYSYYLAKTISCWYPIRSSDGTYIPCRKCDMCKERYRMAY